MPAPLRPLARRVRRSSGGFTLIEIMLVVGIITVLMGAAIYHLAGNLEQAKIVVAEGDIQTVAAQLKSYESFAGFLPSNEQGLKALIERPTTAPQPERWTQMLQSLPTDPWKQPYVYRYPGRKNPRSFDLYSLGPDKQDGTGDEIGNWKNSQ